MKAFLLSAAALLLLLHSGCQQQQEDQGAGDQSYNHLEIVDNEEEEQEGFPFSLFPEEGTPEQEEPEVEEEPEKEETPKGEIEEENRNKEPEQTRETEVPDTTDVKTEVISLTNEERKKHGLDPLKQDEKVAEVAQAKSEDMAENNYFAHQSPTYGTPFEMMQEYGVQFRMAAENIAAGQATPDKAVEGWMNSEDHRKNILNEDLTHIGIGYEENGRYWTQMFIGK
ncbi:CAP domain-containing protein [Salibacterium aidingense]|uniref:CAP domain-containing protein n=1 Tax=Salibacterium aidingense TaxID=384933 RepID=UPI0003FA2FA0|nr:CAP domain-containing protein [Salibacterium aidingense]